MALEPIGVEAVVEGMDNFTGQMGDMQDAIDRTGESADESAGPLSGLGDVLSTVGGIALGVAAAGLAAVSAAIISCIGPAAEAEQIEARFDATLKALGESAAVTKDQALAYAAAMQEVTTYEDDAVLAAETVLLRFTSIGQDVFPAALQASADLAAGLGMDLTQASRTLGMALEDPANGMSRLRRMGVMFTEEEQNTIKAMQEAGDAAGAQALMLDILNSKFGGTAAAMADTYTGRMQQLQNTFGNIKETIGMAVIPALTALGEKFLAVLNDPAVQAAIQSIADWIAVNLPIAIDWLIAKGGELYNWIMANVVPAFQSFWQAIAPVRDIIASLFGGGESEGMASFQTMLTGIFGPEITGAIVAFAGAIGQVGAVFAQIWTDSVQPFLVGFYEKISLWWTEIAPEVQAAWDAIQNRITTIANAIAGFISANMGTIQAYFEGAWQAIQGIIEIAWAIISGIIEVGLNVLQGDWEGAWAAVKELFEGVWNGFVTFIGGIAQELVAAFGLLWAALGPEIEKAWNKIKEWFEGVWQSIYDFLLTVDEALGTNFAAVWAAFSDVVIQSFNAVVDWFSTAWDKVTGFLNGIDLFAIGQDIVESLWNGLKAVWDGVVTWWNENVAPLFGASPGGAGGGTQSMGGGGIQGFGRGEETSKGGGSGGVYVPPSYRTEPIAPRMPTAADYANMPASVRAGLSANIGPITINSQIDEALFIEKVRQAVATAI